MATFAYALTLVVLFAVFVFLLDAATDKNNRHQAARVILFALAAVIMVVAIYLKPPH